MNAETLRTHSAGLASLLLAIVLLAPLAPQAICQTDADIPKDADRIPYWISMMRDPNVKLPTVQKAFEKYFENRKRQRGDGFKPFKRWEYWMLHQVRPDGQRPPEGAMARALATFHTQRPKAAGPAVWRELGPTRVSPDNGRGLIGMGRLNGVTFHPHDPNTIFAVSAGGGVWQTADGGRSWKSLTESLPVLIASILAIDPGTPQTMYLGTGDIEVGMGVGMGVFKSTDGGLSWTPANAGIEARIVGSILIHPSDSRRILVGTDKGVFLSTDAGASWAAASPQFSVTEMVGKPGAPDVIYVAGVGCFLRSEDAGSSWQQVQTGLPQSFMSIGVTPAAPETVYLLLGNAQDSGFAGFYRSTDSGRTFQQRCARPNLLGWSADGSDTSGQAFYDLCLAVDTNRADVVYLGGVNIWRTADGGANWTMAGYWENVPNRPCLHADHHFLAFSPHDGRLFSANDGGLYRLNADGTAWDDLGSGLGISMIYRIGMTPRDPGLVVAGFQDNGTKLLSGEWTILGGGDGMNAIADPGDANFLIWSTYYGYLFRSFDKGRTVDDPSAPLYQQDPGGWVAPVFLDARNPKTLYLGLGNVWRTADIRGRPVSWTKISSFPPSLSQRERTLCVLEQSPADPNLMFAAREDFRLWRTRDASAVSPQWEEITASLPERARVNAMVCSRRDAGTVYLASNGRIYRSTDRGGAWRNITGTLPLIATYCLFHDDVARVVYAGTDFGVFCRPDDDAGDWIPYNAGMPFVPVYDIDIVSTQQAAQPRILRAATYGRGLWEAVPAVRQETQPPRTNLVSAIIEPIVGGRTKADQPLVIARREPFPVTLASGNVEILVAETPDTAGSDLYLRITGNQVATSFEGKWMNAGTLGAVPRTLGKSVHLEGAAKKDDQVVLTFSHSLAAGKTRTIYIRTGGGEWQAHLTVTAKE